MEAFDQTCTLCPRLTTYLTKIKHKYPHYHCLPVASVGAARPRLFIVGLAPGLHGANASGRPFTGDASGVLLYETLHKYGYSNKPQSVSLDDGLKLKGCRITNAVKCLPPENKPTTEEIKTCNVYLEAELNALKSGTVVLALGAVAHEAVLRALALKKRDYAFGHEHIHRLPNGLWLVDSYHCSRYNIQTKRLTTKMFHGVFETIENLE